MEAAEIREEETATTTTPTATTNTPQIINDGNLVQSHLFVFMGFHDFFHQTSHSGFGLVRSCAMQETLRFDG